LRDVPESGGDTIFASRYGAYEALSEPMKKFLTGLTATHDGEQVYRGRYTGRGVDDTDRVYSRAVHPIVRTHPVTGRRALFVNRYFTTHINELSSDESRVLLDYLCTHAEQVKFQCRFSWAPNAVAFWDNRCVQHIAMWDYYPQVRSGYRVTIKGDRPQ
jgi:taurine dioxygenase